MPLSAGTKLGAYEIVALIGAGGAFQASAPSELFQTPLVPGVTMYQYDVSADGRRFLLNVPSERPQLPLTLVVNWQAGFGR